MPWPNLSDYLDEGAPAEPTEPTEPIEPKPQEIAPEATWGGFTPTRKRDKGKKAKRKPQASLAQPETPPLLGDDDETSAHVRTLDVWDLPRSTLLPEDASKEDESNTLSERTSCPRQEVPWKEQVDLVGIAEEPIKVTPASKITPEIQPEPATKANRDDHEQIMARPRGQRSPSISLPPVSVTAPISSPPRFAIPVAPPRRYNNPDGYRSPDRHTPMSQHRRDSIKHLHGSAPRPSYVSPPPPHMPQEHFFRLPDLGFNLGEQKEQGRTVGSDSCCCTFDSFADSGDTLSSKKVKDALLVGFDGGLDVYRVLSDKLEVVGRLEGLRGLVIGAKILPCLQREAQYMTGRPLIALIIHGLMSDDRADSGQDDDATQEVPSQYQTTVEIFSLQTQQHVTTLYKSLPLTIDSSMAGYITQPPQPIGDLILDAVSSFVTVTSGKSGEIYVFSNLWQGASGDSQFRLVGKFWTALQVKQEMGTNDPAIVVADTEKHSSVPLMSLGHRWLAFVPPYTSASHTISGLPLLSASNPTPPGLSSLSAPVQPNVSCEVAGVDAEGMLSWLSRTAAQGLVKASQKGYEISLQGWKELTNPSPPTSKANAANFEQSLFPPTNAPTDDPRRLAKEPALVSLIDLQKLLQYEAYQPKQLPGPFATFALVEGCNYLSFSPDGLRLLTTSRRGEASTIWDMEHIAHGSTKRSFTEDTAMQHGPHVKQVHRIVRSSSSLVIDSVWSRDGDWIALVTTHGTIHLHQVPTSVTGKRRKRRNTVTSPVIDKAEATVGVSQGISPPSNGLWGRFSSGLQSVGTQVNAIRAQGSIQTTFAGFREATGSLKTAGGRAIAKGLSQGITAAKDGASDIWHAEDNKIRHKALQDPATRTSCARWIQRNSDTSLAVICGGAVHLHGVSPISRRKGEVDVPELKQDKRGRKTFALPRISTDRDNNVSMRAIGCTEAGPHGFWSLRATASSDERFAEKGHSVAPMNPTLSAQATEVETNPPYCPFHIDSRVAVFTFEEGSVDTAAALDGFLFRGHGLELENEDDKSWLFGESFPASVKMNDMPLGDHDGCDNETFGKDDDLSDTDSLADQVESRLTVHNIAADGNTSQEIRVATRRTKRGVSESGAGGFDMLVDDNYAADEEGRAMEV